MTKCLLEHFTDKEPLLALVKTGILMVIMTFIVTLLGSLLGGFQGMIIAVLFAGTMNIFAWYKSDSLVLRVYKAKLAPKQSELSKIVRSLSRKAKMPIPKVFIIDNSQPNAFATGRNPENSSVAATTGLLKQLSKEEISAVMAHELAHIKNRDTTIMVITATFAGAISMLANFAMFFGSRRGSGIGIIGTIALMILAPMAASLVQMAISRGREYEADRIGAEICGNPSWLASALKSIQRMANSLDNDIAEQNPSTAHMFIINPLHAHKHDRLFSTHPSTENRVAALKAMEPNYQASTSIPKVSSSLKNKRKQDPNPWSNN